MEEWKPIPGFETYLISNLGRVAKIKGMGILRPNWSGRDRLKYHSVRLYCEGRQHKRLIHKLVYLAFHGEIPDGYQVDHINRDNLDNRAENLRAVTFEENQKNRKCSVVENNSLEILGINI